jgi:hypothetical protein
VFGQVLSVSPRKPCLSRAILRQNHRFGLEAARAPARLVCLREPPQCINRHSSDIRVGVAEHALRGISVLRAPPVENEDAQGNEPQLRI